MRLLVLGDVAFLGKLLGAERALMWLLASVRALVDGDLALLAEPLKKINASGSMQMFPQGHMGVRLVTATTASTTAWGTWSMGRASLLCVPARAWRRGSS